MKTTLSISLALFVIGCVRATPITGPDGREGWTLDCHRDDQCYQEAGKRCGKGYDVIGASERVATVLARNDGFGNTTATPIIKKSLTIQCR
jgi:hypothetical protein